MGFGDNRGILFFEIVRLARRHKPKVLLLENVANVIEHDGGHTLVTILKELRAIGYRVAHRVVNSSLVLPQHRQRIYFVRHP